MPKLGFPKPRPHILERRSARQVAETMRRLAYKAVAERDERQCRCCGRRGQYEATIAANALHHHHLTYRSKQGADTPANICTLCAYCHALEHAKQLQVIGDDANKPLRFEIHEAAVVEVFGTKPLPPHVRIVAESRRRA